MDIIIVLGGLIFKIKGQIRHQVQIPNPHEDELGFGSTNSLPGR